MDPKCWKKAFSKKKGREYYINVEKGTSQWGITNYLTPEGWEIHKSTTNPVEMYYGNTVTGKTQWEQPTFIKPPLPDGWESRITDCGNYYYINRTLNISRWEIPSFIPVAKSPVVKEILEDRVLKWVGNSCYLDSSLFCLFAGPKDFIDDILLSLIHI